MAAYHTTIGRAGDWRSLIMATGRARRIGFVDSIVKGFSP
jgi:hypothetical protein